MKAVVFVVVLMALIPSAYLALRRDVRFRRVSRNIGELETIEEWSPYRRVLKRLLVIVFGYDIWGVSKLLMSRSAPSSPELERELDALRRFRRIHLLSWVGFVLLFVLFFAAALYVRGW